MAEAKRLMSRHKSPRSADLDGVLGQRVACANHDFQSRHAAIQDALLFCHRSILNFAWSAKMSQQHSWGVLRDGVLETTEGRLKYFGIVLQGERADFFAVSNS